MIPTEPIGSLPRLPARIDAVLRGDVGHPRLDALDDEAERDTAFAKIRARIEGTALAAAIPGAA